jgi:hypothetical protein
MRGSGRRGHVVYIQLRSCASEASSVELETKCNTVGSQRKILLEPCNCLLQRALIASLHVRDGLIRPDREAMCGSYIAHCIRDGAMKAQM